MLRSLCDAALNASGEPDREAKSCQWRGRVDPHDHPIRAEAVNAGH